MSDTDSRDASMKEPITLEEILQRYDVVGLGDPEVRESTPDYMVVAPKELTPTNKMAGPATETFTVSQMPMFGEMGMSGSAYSLIARSDYNPELRGYLGLRKFDQMRKSDGQVRATLRLVKTPVLAARWYVQPASPSKKDKKIAEFVWRNFTEWMTISWPQVLSESLLCLDFGWFAFEKVWGFAPPGYGYDGKVMLQKLAPRHPFDCEQWDYDSNGGPNSASFFSEFGGNSVTIPIDKLLVFTYDKEAGNMEGVSLLRSAYKHWYFKEQLYKIDAIQKERHGIGIPVIKLPPGFSPEDKKLADEIGRNLRTNEKAHIVTPPNWEITFAQIIGNPVDAIASIEHHDMQIARNILAGFFGADTNGKELQDLFIKGTRYIADTLRDVFNKYCIPQLIGYNWPNITELPELRARRIGDSLDWRTTSFALRNLVGADIITPDQPLEDWTRDEMDLPDMDPATTRTTPIPQAPGASVGTPLKGQPDVPELKGATVMPTPPGAPTSPAAPVPGPPRQSRAKNQQGRTGKSNTGRDGGGK